MDCTDAKLYSNAAGETVKAFHFPPEAIEFLRGLKENNNREWFAAHRENYISFVKEPSESFCRLMTNELDEWMGREFRSKIFRIYRDVRFSKDKTPYKTYQHILFAAGDHRSARSAWFFGLEPDRLVLGAGKLAFDRDGLLRYREAVAGRRGAKLAKVLANLQSQGARMNGPALKRVPNGYDKANPHVDLLRHKGLALWIDLDTDAAIKGDLVATCLSGFEKLKPLIDWLEA
ncbi:MAG TPA: DUF2461 domain-containing protein [Rhodobacteraceae bacterium]|nr:DUF2461 domain-containing protein [Paracoccaceae bacterium]